MKPTDIPGTRPQTTARSGSGASGGKASVNQTGAAALQSAGTVVANAERKKGADKNPVRIEAEGAVPDLPAAPGAGADPGPPVLAGQDVLPPGEKKQQRKNAPDVTPRTASTADQNPGKVGSDHIDLHQAVAFAAKSKGKEPVTAKPHRRRPQPPQQQGEIGLLPDTEEKPPLERPGIAGVDDRVPHMAMVAGAATPLLRPPKLTTSSAVQKLRPKSRAECQRRCGCNGFCNPSSPLGCGGVYCGRKNDGV
jgi:hypothetical protein